MSFTRFHDDPARIQKTLEESFYSGDYYINAPGPGVFLPFQQDAEIRLQKWGANMQTNTVNLESDLRGLSRLTNWHHTDAYDYTKHSAEIQGVDYPVSEPFTEESRASHPAWMYRDLPHDNWSFPQLNPQNLATVEPPFIWDVQTRILQRDHFGGAVDDLTFAKPRYPPFEPRNAFPQ
jgi:hypothetical protein